MNMMLLIRAFALAAVTGALLSVSALAADVGQPVTPYVGAAPIGNANPAPVTCISGCASPVVAASGGSAVLAVGAVSANVALPASVTSFPTLLLVNNGTVDLFYNVGIGAGTAATTSPSATNLKLAAGRAIQFAPATSVTFVAAILASGSTATELDVYQLTAPSLIAGGGGSGGGGTGGSVTQGTSPWVVSVPTWAGGTLGAMANYGTSPGAVLVPGMNAFITNVPTVTANAGTNLNTSALALEAGNLATLVTDFGAPGAAACTTDTASCNQNQQLQRLAQRLTTINTTLNAPMQNSGGSVTANAGTNLNTSALALEAGNLATLVTDFGAPGATACTTDTASCNQNQQLQRLAQRLSTLITAVNSPFQAGGSIGNTTFAATSATSSNFKAQVDPLTSASWALGAFAASMPANGQGIGLFDGTNMVRAKGDETSGIWVNIKAGAGSGGTAIADKAAWTVSSTSATPMAGEFTTGGATACATAQACTVAMLADRSIFTNVADWAGSPITGAVTAYGTAPTGNVPGFNAFVTNSNANIGNNTDGVAASAASVSPVGSFNLLWNGSTWDRMPGSATGAQVKVASGGVASGGFASGAFASGSIGSGAFASGAVASGAYASGSLASGAVVDLTNMSAATGAAPPSKAMYLGANASGATGGHVAGLITCDNHVFKHITTATDTLAVQGVASQSIYICAWRSRAAGTATWFLENTASANANCASSNTQINGLASEVVNGGEVFAPPFWTGLKNTSGNGLCINSTGTGGIDIDVWYAQL